MANGDAAAAAGYPTVASTDDVRLGYDEINLTRDLIADAHAELPDAMAWGGFTPSNIAAGGYGTGTVNFPVGRFSSAPRVVVSPASTVPDKRSVSVSVVTATYFTWYQHNGTGSSSSAFIHWIAVGS
jgi:hypothetical protein